MIDLLQKSLELLQARQPVAQITLVNTVGSVPQVPGARMLVTLEGERSRTFGTVGGGRLEYIAIEEALEVLRTRRPRFVEKDLNRDLSMACGGRVAYFIEPLCPADALVICGGGHVGQALAHVMTPLELSLTVIDSRPEYANVERFPGARQIINSHEPEELERSLQTDDRTMIVIVSRDHPTDFRMCRYFLNRPWRYLGVIASAGKSATLRRELKEEGYPLSQIERISSPIGLPIGGATPAEIAISIAAELVQRMNEGSKKRS